MGIGKTTHEISPSATLQLADGTLISATNPMPSQLYVDDKDNPGTLLALDGKATGSGINVPYFILCDETGNAINLLLTQADGAPNTANAAYVTALNYGFNGSTWDRLRSSIANGLAVDVTRSISSVVDANNSTTTPLGSGATFTGTGTDCEGYASVAITIYADEDSGASGMQFQFSTDNTNWDDVYSFTLDTADSDTRRFQFPICAQYFRVVYTNGSTGQAAFRVQTLLHRTNILTSIHRIGNSLTLDRSAELVRAVIAGETTAGGGSMVNVKVQPSGQLASDANLAIYVDENGNELTVKRAVINDATSGNNTIVAAVVGKKIRVLDCVLISRGTVLARFEDGAGGTALTGQMQLYSGTGFTTGYNKHGHFETTANTLLNLELSAAINVDGWLQYVEV
jgi:hypothetical protein